MKTHFLFTSLLCGLALSSAPGVGGGGGGGGGGGDESGSGTVTGATPTDLSRLYFKVSARASAGLTIYEGTSNNPVLSATATAPSGDSLATVSATRLEASATYGAQSAGASAMALAGLTLPLPLLMDPPEAGVAAEINYQASASGQETGTPTGHETNVGFFGMGSAASNEWLVDNNPNTPQPSTLQGTISVGFGHDAEFHVQASADIASTSNTTGAVVDYELILFEDRKHWRFDAAGSVGTVAHWVEEQTPGGTQYAVFNQGENLALTANLDSNRSMRGLIADGNNVTLNLASNTLTLTDTGASRKNYNILVGEGYNRPSSLTLRNGIVNAEKDVNVGFDNGSSENVNLGTLNVLDGAQLTTDGALQLSNEAFTEGILDIRGVGSKLAAFVTRIGKFGTGTATVRTGGQLATEDALVIGLEPGSHGTLNAQSTVTAKATTVGLSGTGILNTSATASLNLGSVVIGQNAGSHGDVQVAGGTTVETVGIVVGKSGDGVLTVTGNSTVNTDVLDIALQPGSNGLMAVSDATLSVDAFGEVGKGGPGSLDAFGAAILHGSGVLNIGQHGIVKLRNGTAASGFGFNIKPGGRLEVTDGASFVGQGNGFICTTGGSVLFSGSQGNSINASFTIESTDAVVTDGSTLNVLDAIVAPAGVLTVSGGGTRMTIGDSMAVNGSLIISSGAVVEGANDLAQLAIGQNAHVSGSAGSLKFKNINNKFGVILPGNSPGTMTFDGDYVQGSGGMMQMEIGGTGAGTEFDQLIITGNATINGIIVLKFINGYTPTAGQQFNIIDAAGSFTGSPRVIVQGLAPGWQFTTGFDVLSGEFRINSTSNGVAGPPPSADINNLDGDSDTNFMEFAFGTDPAVSDSGVMQVTGNTMIRRGSPIVSLTNTPTGVDYRAVFCQRKDRASLGLTYTVQFSADLTTWQDSAATPTLVADDGDYEAVSVRYPFFVNGKKARFFRVAVSTP